MEKINYKAVANAIEQAQSLYASMYDVLDWESKRACEQALARARGCIAHLRTIESLCN